MPDQSVLLEKVRRYFEYAGKDVDRAHEIYHDDAVLEFPQSGERFEGVANFREWRRQYPAEVRFRVRRVTAREDLVVVEVSASYDGGPWGCGVQLLAFRDEKVARERIYGGTPGRPPSGGPPGARTLLQTRRSEALTLPSVPGVRSRPRTCCSDGWKTAGQAWSTTRHCTTGWRAPHWPSPTAFACVVWHRRKAAAASVPRPPGQLGTQPAITLHLHPCRAD